MDSRQAQQLALDIESDELIGEADRVLSAEDILPVLEALWDRGADFSFLLVGEAAAVDGQALDQVSED